MEPKIQNIVSTANVGHNLDLAYLAGQMKNIEYNPNKFIAAIQRLKNPRTTCLIFPSGRLVITGAKSIVESHKAARRFSREIQRARNKQHLKTTFADFFVRNIVASFNLKKKINLHDLYNARRQNCTFDQETFPGLKYKPCSTENTIAIIFNSGKVIITGALTINKIDEMYMLLKRILLRFTYL